MQNSSVPRLGVAQAVYTLFIATALQEFASASRILSLYVKITVQYGDIIVLTAVHLFVILPTSVYKIIARGALWLQQNGREMA